ncbi:MAG: DUF1292 domain-containing protein [Firmicutes bacterium]|uniref:DUF1292 domain-containing protein n=1 Tax=Candidatus Scybalomonas excrementavium TaxID=2840943 RepID=A0A9D9HZH1_9FIRM|nr:DUF1292 domain-containing protein [Candidatus Scybalomonas excrementavium]
MEQRDVIPFVTEDGEELELYVLEQTKLNGKNYLLVADSLEEEDEDVEVYIMKEAESKEGEEFASYEFVEEDTELEALGKIFEELLEDVDIEL